MLSDWPTPAAAVLCHRSLAKVVSDYAPHLSASHLAAAIGVLAGLATGKQLQQQVLQEDYQAPAAHWARLFQQKLQEATLLDCAR